jgi:hypothetical protein
MILVVGPCPHQIPRFSHWKEHAASVASCFWNCYCWCWAPVLAITRLAFCHLIENWGCICLHLCLMLLVLLFSWESSFLSEIRLGINLSSSTLLERIEHGFLFFCFLISTFAILILWLNTICCPICLFFSAFWGQIHHHLVLANFCGGILLGCTEILPPLATFLGLQAIVPQEELVLQVLLILVVAVLLISTASSTSTTALLDLRE